MADSINIPLFRTDIARRLDEFIRYTEMKRIVDSIGALQRQRRFRTLSVLSFLPGEGKTLLCAALARAYVENFLSRVLVIDTAPRLNPTSLDLRTCLAASRSIDFLSLDEHRKNLEELMVASRPFRIGASAAHANAVKPESRGLPVVRSTASMRDGELINHSGWGLVARRSDELLVQQTVNIYSGAYGLILVDTVPLTAKNKDNVDPLIIARKSDASVLVVSRRLIEAPDIEAHLKMLEDPSLHLLGVVSNEEFPL